MEQPEKPLRIVTKQPVLATDGNSINIREDGTVELSFIQIIGDDEKEIRAQGVAGVRLSLDQLKALGESIGKSIDDFETKQRAKSGK